MSKPALMRVGGAACAYGLALVVTVAQRADADRHEPNLLTVQNAAGSMRTFNDRGAIDFTNAFFQDFGRNGRRCVDCHMPEDGWTITPASLQRRFQQSQGLDPVFRSNDGANCEGAMPTTLAESQQAYSLLLTRGLIRVGLDVPANAEFVVEGVEDPYDCPPATNDVSVYRRPLPSANVRFLTAIMWDGRESSGDSTIDDDLMHQANSATRGHAEAFQDLTLGEAREIVEFQRGLLMAQSRDGQAGPLMAQGAKGDPLSLRREEFFIGINDPVGMNPTGAPFNPRVFTLFDAWERSKGDSAQAEARRSIYRGQEVFNTRPIVLSGVSGLNEETFPSGVTVPASFTGTCTICHDTPNVGNHSVKAPLDIGLTTPDVAAYLPVYTLRNIDTGAKIRTTDPGRALITGKWRDVNRFKGPVLRALAQRGPFFHNGSAATLEEVVEFYDRRFSIGLTAQEKADLVAFLKAL